MLKENDKCLRKMKQLAPEKKDSLQNQFQSTYVCWWMDREVLSHLKILSHIYNSDDVPAVCTM